MFVLSVNLMVSYGQFSHITPFKLLKLFEFSVTVRAPVCTSVAVFCSKLSQLVTEEDETVQHMFFLPPKSMPSLVPPFSLSLFFFFSRPFSPRSNVENVASPKPPPLPSKSPKIKSNPTLLFYSALSLRSPSSSRCQKCSTLPTHRSVNMV